MSRQIRRVMVVAVAATTMVACHVATPRATVSPAAALDPYTPDVPLDSALRDTVAWYRNEWMIPGAAFGTFTCDTRRLAWDGVTRVGEHTPLGPHARFPVEMSAPPLLATAALRLERRGVLRLDEPLRELWPAAARRAPWYADITLADLLSLVAPIPAFVRGDSASLIPEFPADRRQSAASRATRWFLDQLPDSFPAQLGTTFPSIVVATGVLEHVTGQPIAEVLRDEVFAPLGLRATFLPRGTFAPDQPRGHFGSGDTLRYPGHAKLAGPPAFFEASELQISLPDYVTFLQAHLCALQGRSNPLLTHAEALRMFGDTESGASTPLGWGALNTDEPIREVHSFSAGFSAAGGFSKATGRGVLMLLNVEGMYAFYASAWVWADGLGTEPGMPRSRSRVPRRVVRSSESRP